MKKKLLILGALLTVAAVSNAKEARPVVEETMPSPTFVEEVAPTNDSQTNIYAKLGLEYFGKTKDIDSQKFPFKDKSVTYGGKIKGLGFFGAVELTHEFIPDLELGLGIAYHKHGSMKNVTFKEKVDGKDVVRSISQASTASIPLYATAKYNIKIDEEVTPYIKGNVGYAINFMEGNDFKGVEGNDLFKDMEIKAGNGLHIGAGAGVEYNNFTFEAMYLLTNNSLTFNKTGGADKTTAKGYSNGTFAFSVGYKFQL